ncbi:internal scaffolding protein [Blackfly microvirus SF02]|uniref:Internal scaffolding protein n=1 Tax=Blackfly microvirus SF02 TaxID=2576452 RepID=A0A4P8PQA2_9VIRU|nr:internal scaffolding protein [Blackfly microvirus SF02]
MTKVNSVYDKAADDLEPPFNVYAGRDTSKFAITKFMPSLAQQEFAAECDVNAIMARYSKTGTVPVYADRQPFYVDNIDMPDFQAMQNILISARESFMSLPADVRRQFDNDPAKFVDFATDPENDQKLREWNMLSPEALQRLDAAQAAADANAAAEAVQAAEKAAGGDNKPAKPVKGPS